MVMRRRICSMGRRARNRIEQRKQQQTREKSANMRLPGDAGAISADRDRSEPEDDVDTEPDSEKTEHASVPQSARERQRGHLRCGFRVAAIEGQEAAAHESKSNG